MGKNHGKTKMAVTAVYLIVVMIIIILFGNALQNPNEKNISLKPDFEQAIDIDKQVKVIFDDGQERLLNLPQRVLTSDPFRLEVNLEPYGDTKGKSICVRVAYVNFACFADGKKIYEYYPSKAPFAKSGGYSIHMIDLPDTMKSKIITMQYEPIFQNIKSHKIAPISFGKRLNIVLTHLVYREMMTILFLFMLFFIFLMTLSITIINRLKKRYDNQLLYGGVLCLVVALYFMAQLWTVNYLLHPYSTAIYFMEYFSIMLIPLPALGMHKGRLNPKYDILFRLSSGAILLNFIMQSFLLVKENIEFRQMLIFTHGVLLICVILSMIAVIFTKSKDYPEKKFLLISMMPLWLNMVLSILAYFLYGRVMYNSFLLFVVVVFVGIQIYSIIKNYSTVENEKIKSKIYQEMALKDTMTGLKNRSAYSAWIKEAEEKKRSFGILSIDLNNLKKINDYYGHQSGDELIIGFAQLLQKQASMIKCENVFRIGGDEFVLFLTQDKEFDIEEFIQLIKKEAHAYSLLQDKMDLDFASGYYYHDPATGETIEESLSKADKRMYEDKAAAKNTLARQMQV